MSDLDPRPAPGEDYQEEPDETTGAGEEFDAADAAEQRRSVMSADAYRSRPYVSRDDVDPADAADQEAEIEVDEEDYR